MFDLNRLVRPNILALTPYSSARNDFQGAADVFLDANENAFGSPAGMGLNRYPDPMQRGLKARLAEVYGSHPQNIFVGNGSDEAIDLLFRIFCEPARDETIICPPTYGMYKVSAQINDVTSREVPLTRDFGLDVDHIRDVSTERTKLIFICSPNNPTGNVMSRESITAIAETFPGLVVVDEAYLDFSDQRSLIGVLGMFPNMVVMRTCSKAWGMAGLRVGLAFASTEIIDLMNRVKPPYNVSQLAQDAAIDGLREKETMVAWLDTVKNERTRLAGKLQKIAKVKHVYPSDANFLLVRFIDADSVYAGLMERGVVVRNRSRVPGCEGCLRITIGTPTENDLFLQILKEMA